MNLVGQVAVTQAFLPLIRQAKGTIVFIASIGGRIASPFMSPYNTSKFAVEALGESLRHELARGASTWPWSSRAPSTPQIWAKGAETIGEQIERMSDDARRLYGKQLARFGEVLDGDRRPRDPAGEGRRRGPQGDQLGQARGTATWSARDAKIAARLKGTLPDRAFLKLAAPADEDADRRAGRRE